MEGKYTNERNVQMLIKILKENKIKKVIASPGTTNISFVASIQNDSFFEIYSCVDERSACYMACGLAVESGEPVVLTCTGATASRNYLSGLTEAYYRKIPILAVTCAQHFSRLGSYSPQCLDRTSQLKDIVNLSVQVPSVNSIDDERGCNLLLNKAVLELKRNGGGPVHINIETKIEGKKGINVEKLPDTKIIERIQYNDNVPNIIQDKVGIFVGAHFKWDEELTKQVDIFCEKYNGCVICDHTSNYHGKYRILGNILYNQDKYVSKFGNFNLIIHIGSVTGSYMNVPSNEIWRVNPDGEVRDAFCKIKKVFQMEEVDFFKKYNSLSKSVNISNYKNLSSEIESIRKISMEKDYPFSNIYVAKNIIERIPNNSTVHLGILNSLRSWNFFETTKSLYVYSNTGGFGIDGPMSTLIGASLSNPRKIYYGVVGDLAFFYDMNSLGNRNVKNNIRIVLINNGCGTEFHNYNHPAAQFGDEANSFIAANGHFGNKSELLVKNYVENLGFEYVSAKNKEEFLKNVDYFTEEKLHEKPLVFEIFTDSNDESEALRIIRNLCFSTDGYLIKKAKSLLSPDAKKVIKKLIGKE
ncbi:MAG: 2-succinyl-5-enolpyruvyl-6-hydroxy-3-cyclohexene-1-carboxylate synthase [Firmicutes bacterium]|nr:2-succinyl-5-enolpyruvyl-6-hydroxy-3-cyclohexene-1-carboxylate synthase [Bacillota bacterium]